jgi:general secretion pathway protein G
MACAIVIGKTVLTLKKQKGFTLIELLVVMTIIAVLLSIAAPRYMRSVDDAREATLKSSLAQMREAIDQYNADQGQLPLSLNDLVEKKYLRSIPLDPITQSAETWQVAPPPGDQEKNQVYDVHSGAPGSSRSGEPYAKW